MVVLKIIVVQKIRIYQYHRDIRPVEQYLKCLSRAMQLLRCNLPCFAKITLVVKRTSWMAWMLKLSSTFVNGAANKCTINPLKRMIQLNNGCKNVITLKGATPLFVLYPSQYFISAFISSAHKIIMPIISKTGQKWTKVYINQNLLSTNRNNNNNLYLL